MQPRVTAVTLAARDLPALRDFYAALFGREPFTYVEDEVAFFDLSGLVLCLWTALRGEGRGVQLAHNVRSAPEVDAVHDAAADAGATVVSAAADQAWGGRSATFADPEGHEWEVAWNDRWPLDADGRVALPAS